MQTHDSVFNPAMPAIEAFYVFVHPVETTHVQKDVVGSVTNKFLFAAVKLELSQMQILVETDASEGQQKDNMLLVLTLN